jgi:hypothetical protein
MGVDPNQLGLLNAFRQKLGEIGTLYWKYRNRDEFVRLLRLHLSRQVQDWGKRWGGKVKNRPDIVQAEGGRKNANQGVQPFPVDNHSGSGDDGYLDLIEKAVQSLRSVAEIPKRMTQAIQRLGGNVSQCGQEAKQMLAVKELADIQAVKKLSNRAAGHMSEFVSSIKSDIPLLEQAYSSACDSVSRACALFDDFSNFDRNEVVALLAMMRDQRTVLAFVRDKIDGLKASIIGIPRVTTALNRAKRETVSILEKLMNSLASSMSFISECEKVLEDWVTRH